MTSGETTGARKTEIDQPRLQITHVSVGPTCIIRNFNDNVKVTLFGSGRELPRSAGARIDFKWSLLNQRCRFTLPVVGVSGYDGQFVAMSHHEVSICHHQHCLYALCQDEL